VKNRKQLAETIMLT